MRIYILFLLASCALKYFNQGDYAAVHAVLEDVERETELQRAQMRAEAAKNEIQGYAEAEAAYQKALEIRARLAARNPDAYEPNLAATLWI